MEKEPNLQELRQTQDQLQAQLEQAQTRRQAIEGKLVASRVDATHLPADQIVGLGRQRYDLRSQLERLTDSTRITELELRRAQLAELEHYHQMGSILTDEEYQQGREDLHRKITQLQTAPETTLGVPSQAAPTLKETVAQPGVVKPTLTIYPDLSGEFDGRRFQLSDRQARVLRALQIGQKTHSRVISKQALGEADLQRSDLKYFAAKLRSKLGEDIVRVGGRGNNAGWWLEGIEQVVWVTEGQTPVGAEPQVKESPHLVEKVAQKLPKVTINRDTRVVVVEFDGQSKQAVIKNEAYFQLLVHLAQHPNQRVEGIQLVELLRAAGRQTQYPVGEAVKQLRSSLEADPKNPALLQRVGLMAKPAYKLSAEIEFSDEKAVREREIYETRVVGGKESQQRSTIILPDGQEIDILGGRSAALLQALLNSSDQQRIGTEDLARQIYGKSNRLTNVRVSHLVGSLRDKLEPLGWTIIQPVGIGERSRGKQAEYYLQRIQPQVEPPVSPEPAAILRPQEVEEVIVEVPYQPSPEQIMTEEEMKVLQLVTQTLTGHTRLWWDRLEAELLKKPPKGRVESIGTGGSYRIRRYTPREMMQIYAAAHDKILSREKIPLLEESRSEDEKRLWQAVETLRASYSAGDRGQFLRKIAGLISSAEHEYFTDHPEEKDSPYLVI